MPKLKKGEQLLSLASGLYIATCEDEANRDSLPTGWTLQGRINSESNVRIGSTPFGEVRRAFADWTKHVKGIAKDLLEEVRMHIAYNLDDEEMEKILRDWHAADATSRVKMIQDMGEALANTA